ncbi:unnamed protein product [Hermetia illucens]|uniref:Uncharacterized protein n=1 Tax=Hermetia illucens TaxID=343691 RepID=A0A7R8YLS3_HERIL|nr:unnamed protein product [Hermetia illucens]
METWVWYQVRLKFSQINVECTVESQGGRDRGVDLANKPVQVDVASAFNIQVVTANIVDSLVANHENAVRVFEGRAGG